ncbi:MAG: flagellar hook-basal body protein [Fibrobacter sp.]|nr:flagellar hook-basal body protein [Fibrobacter sp.]
MVNGLYTARDGMVLMQQMVDNTSHNLANANTTGFKKSLMSTMAAVDNRRNDEALLVHDETHWMAENRVSWQQGSLVSTENQLDIALEGEGLLMVETPEGVRFTRGGSLTINPHNELTTLQGFSVLDEAENPILLDGAHISISNDGTIEVDGMFQAKLAVVDFEDKSLLLREGRGTYAPQDLAMDYEIATDFKVRQGYLEASNVNIIESMVDMIRFQRNYELDQKAVHSIDETLQKAVNEIGRL